MSETTDMTAAGAGVYEVPEELRDYRDLVNRLAQEQIAPRAAEIDEKGRIFEAASRSRSSPAG